MVGGVDKFSGVFGLAGESFSSEDAERGEGGVSMATRLLLSSNISANFCGVCCHKRKVD